MAESKVKVLLTGSDQLTPEIKKAEASLNNLASKADKLDKIQKDFDKITNSTKPLRVQLKQLQTIMAQMNLDGLDNSPLFTEMAQRAGELSDAMGDARQAIGAFADDNFKLKAMTEGLTLVASAGSIATGAMGLFGTENEKVTQAILKVQSALAILNGVQAVANVLNKDSALMLRLKQVRMLASTKTTVADSVATSANSVSMGANTVATTLAQKAREKLNYTIAIGKALMGDWTGLVLLGVTALTTYAIATSDSSDEMKKEQEEIKKASESKQKYIDNLASSTAKMVSKYDELKESYKRCKTEGEKTQWIKNNKTEMNNLGLSVKNVVDADNVFVKNTDKVIKAFELRAQAAALQTLKEEEYLKKYKKIIDADNSVAGGGYYKNQKQTKIAVKDASSIPDEWKKAGLTEKDYKFEWGGGQNGNGFVTILQSGIDKVNRYRQDQARKTNKKIHDDAEREFQQRTRVLDVQLDKTRAEYENLGIESVVPFKGGGGNNNNSNNKNNENQKNSEIIDLDSIKYAEQQLKKFQDEKVRIPIDATDKLKENEDNIKYWEKELERRKIVVELTTQYDDENLKSLQSDLKKLVDERKNLKIGVDDARINELNQEVSDVLAQLHSRKVEIFITTNYDNSTLKGLRDHLKDLQDYQATISIDDVETQKLINEEIEKTKKTIESTEIKLGIKPIIEEGSTNALDKEISDVMKEIKNINPELHPEKYQELIDKFKLLKKTQQEVNEEFERATDITEKPSLYFEPEKLVKGNNEDKRQSYENAMSQINKIGSNVEMGITGKEEAQAEIDKIIEQLQAEIPDLKIKIKVKEDGTIENIKKESISTADALGIAGQAIQGMGQAMGNLAQDNEGLAKAVLIAQAIGQLVLSFATAMTQAAAQGPWAWIAAGVAGAATLTALIAQMQSFDQGGIVQGSSYFGDKTLVRANAGEMILNRKQQNNLYKAIKNDNLGNNNIGGNVTFRIDGTTLKGVLNNVNKKIARQS